MTHDEVRRIAAVMDNDRNAYAVAAIRLLMVIGARKNEILKLRWSEIDRDRNIATIPDSKSGRKKLFLSPAALGVLDNIDKISGNPYVICGKLEGQHLVGLRKPFLRICADADLEGIRLHDLRHTYGSLAAQGGASLLLIGKLLGHKNTSTTQRYAHLVDMHTTEVNEKVGDILNIGN